MRIVPGKNVPVHYTNVGSSKWNEPIEINLILY